MSERIEYYHITPARNVKSILHSGLRVSKIPQERLGTGVWLYDSNSIHSSTIHASSSIETDHSILEVRVPEGCIVDSKKLGLGSDIYDVHVARCSIPPSNVKYLGQLNDLLGEE